MNNLNWAGPLTRAGWFRRYIETSAGFWLAFVLVHGLLLLLLAGMFVASVAGAKTVVAGLGLVLFVTWMGLAATPLNQVLLAPFALLLKYFGKGESEKGLEVWFGKVTGDKRDGGYFPAMIRLGMKLFILPALVLFWLDPSDNPGLASIALMTAYPVMLAIWVKWPQGEMVFNITFWCALFSLLYVVGQWGWDTVAENKAEKAADTTLARSNENAMRRVVEELARFDARLNRGDVLTPDEIKRVVELRQQHPGLAEKGKEWWGKKSSLPPDTSATSAVTPAAVAPAKFSRTIILEPGPRFAELRVLEGLPPGKWTYTVTQSLMTVRTPEWSSPHYFTRTQRGDWGFMLNGVLPNGTVEVDESGKATFAPDIPERAQRAVGEGKIELVSRGSVTITLSR